MVMISAKWQFLQYLKCVTAEHILDQAKIQYIRVPKKYLWEEIAYFPTAGFYKTSLLCLVVSFHFFLIIEALVHISTCSLTCILQAKVIYLTYFIICQVKNNKLDDCYFGAIESTRHTNEFRDTSSLVGPELWDLVAPWYIVGLQNDF